jgi:hypothetical protein
MDYFQLLWILYWPYFITLFLIIIGAIIFWYLYSRLVTKAVAYIKKDGNGFFWEFHSDNGNFISKEYFGSISSARNHMLQKLKERGIIVD